MRRAVARPACDERPPLRQERARDRDRVSSPVGLSKSACPRARGRCGSGSRICTYANGFRARYPAIGPSRNGWGGSSGNRTLTDRLRADCSSLELKTLGGGLGGSRTLISRVKSPVSFLLDDEPSCYLFLATLSFMIIPSLSVHTPPSFIVID